VHHISNIRNIPSTYITIKLRKWKHMVHISDIADIYPVKITFITKLFHKILY
jgi:hypothetical protein